MKGGIYTDQRCPICGGSFVDTRKDLSCPSHPRVKATRLKVKFGKLCKRFRSYEQADVFLNGVRHETTQGKYNEKDYRRENPLAFDRITEKYLEVRKSELKPRAYAAVNWHIRTAQGTFGSRNVKDIKFGDLEDFFLGLYLSNKTKHNIKTTLHHFFQWVSKREQRHIMPDFPEIAYVLGYRNTISKEQQFEVLAEIKRISWHINPKIYLGIKWLTTYISVRPGEMVKLIEGNIDLANGYLHFPDPKEGQSRSIKSVPILDEDVDILKGFPPTVPGQFFFRHPGGISGVSKDEHFGGKYFYKWWIKACANLGIVGVDMYGGTRHSSARALRRFRTPEEIKRATMHSTNKAFERYFTLEADDLRSIYQDANRVIKIDPRLTLKKKGVKPN